MELPQPPTRVVHLTPPGRAAVAVVLVAGPAAVRIVDKCLQRTAGRRFVDLPLNEIILGRWGGPDGEEVIACRRSQDTVEIHCHGGLAAVRAVIALLGQLGCESLSWQHWLGETASDPIRAAAQVALAEAPTARTAAVLVDQFHGALAEAIRNALRAVVAADWPSAAATLEAVLLRRGVGLHLTRPWRVVLAGRPNVGKSSLMNALVGYQRAIVCDLPGTTRDVVTAITAMDGWPVELADTAGLRESQDSVESEGVAKATAVAANADLVLLLEDSLDGTASDLQIATPLIRVLNKIDLLPVMPESTGHRWEVCISAITGAGIADLVAAIGRALVPSPPAGGEAVPFTVEQIVQLELAQSAIKRQDAAAVCSCLQPLVL